MKKRKIILLAGLVVTAAAVTTVGLVNHKTDEVRGADISFTWDQPFVCENWFNSGKGFMFEFTYEKGTADDVEDYIQFALMCRQNGEDKMITSNYPGRVIVDGNDNVSAYMGNIIKNESGTYTYTAMFSDFKSNWNTGINGTETVEKIYFRWGSLQLYKVRACLIESRMNVSPKAQLRDEEIDDVSGLKFNAYLPEVKSDAKYGMAIVPNEYVGKSTTNYIESIEDSGKTISKSYCNPQQITPKETELFDRYGGGYYIKCSMAVKENNYMRDFSAIPFEEINGVRKYAWNTNEECDSLYKVCSRSRKNNISYGTKADAYRDNVLAQVKNRTSSFTTSHLNTYIVDNSVQVRKNESLSNGDRVLTFKAAKGETETGQLILSSTFGSNLTYFAGVSDLVNGSNIISCENIETDVQHYVNITSNWSSTSSHSSFLSDLYAAPYGVENQTLGWWPDALIPMHAAVRDGRNVINPTNGSNQGLFFRINVPENAVAGTYTGNVVIYVVNEGLINVPVSLTVNNFSIAGRKDSNNIIVLNKTSILNLYYPGGNYNNMADSPEYASAYSFLGERGISGGLMPKSWVNTNFEDYIRIVKDNVTKSKTYTYLVEYNQAHVTMDWTYRTGSSTTRTIKVNEDVFILNDLGEKKGLKTFLRGLFDASTNDCDLLKGAVFYDPHADEPATPSAYVRNLLNYNVMKIAIDQVLSDVASVTGKDSVKESLRNVFYLMTAGPEQGIAGKENSYAFLDVADISNINIDSSAECCCDSLSEIQYREMNQFCPNMMWDWNSGINWEEKSYKFTEDNIEGYIEDGYATRSDLGKARSSCGYCYDGLAGIYAGTDTTNRMWEYTCIQPVSPYPSFTLNSPMIRIRSNRWRQSKLNIEGFMYYMSNRAENHPDDGTEYTLTEQQILDGGIYYSGASSDGLLIYPVRDLLGYTDRNLCWLSSLRLENEAEANDDVKYLNYAKELIAQHGNQTEHINILKNIYNSLTSDTIKNRPSAVTSDPTTLKAARNNLIAFIEELI